MGRLNKDCELSYSNPILRNRHSDEVTDLLTGACTGDATTDKMAELDELQTQAQQCFNTISEVPGPVRILLPELRYKKEQ